MYRVHNSTVSRQLRYALTKERLAQRLRYCRIMPMKRRNAPAWTPGQGETAPWTARFDGFVKPRKSKKHNSYSILAA